MIHSENFLHTTHRTVAWFNKAFLNGELLLSAPFQRNPVWTTLQKAYLIDTILHGLPIPELYMQDSGNEEGEEEHIVVDGQQRIRAVLEYIQGQYKLEGDDIARQWKDAAFEDLSPDEKKVVFGYKFVVRILPSMDEEGVRKIFARLNRNVVSLNDQELRNATYWGPFIASIQRIADEDQFWAESGIFSANDHRRMIDHEFISELAAAYLHGPQNKKDRLDQYYQMYEESFEEAEQMIGEFRKITSEIFHLIPGISGTRWKKKSDFYTLFLTLAPIANRFPLSSDERERLSGLLHTFAGAVDSILRIEESNWVAQDENVMVYARSVARAASDKANRISRQDSLRAFLSI
jgi:hypothetical protein